MSLNENPLRQRITYVAKQFPKAPWVTLDLAAVLADRYGPKFWREAVGVAAAEADPALLADLCKRSLALPSNKALRKINSYQEVFFARTALDDRADETVAWRKIADAVVQMLAATDEFGAATPLDPLIPWAARELQRAGGDEDYFDILDFVRTVDPEMVAQWMRKKKPDVSKLDSDALKAALRDFEATVKPESVMEWKDGWKVVALKTSAQIGRVGDALGICLASDSSYHEDYCERVRDGRTETFAVVDPRGEPQIAIEWRPGAREPEQVYAEGNTSPDLSTTEAKRADEWIRSRGGKGVLGPLSGLAADARQIAQVLLDKDDYEDEELAAAGAQFWTNSFSVNDAIDWIGILGGGSYDLASKLELAGVYASEWRALPGYIRDWISDYGDILDEDDVKLVALAEHFGREMSRADATRPATAASPLELLEREHGGGSAQGLLDLGGAEGVRKTHTPAVLPKLPRGLVLPDRGREADNAHWFREGWVWANVDPWQGFHYAKEAAAWWAAGFSPEEAALWQFEVHNLGAVRDQRRVLPTKKLIALASLLKQRGIGAADVIDALSAYPGTLDLLDVSAVTDAVEARRKYLRENRRARRLR